MSRNSIINFNLKRIFLNFYLVLQVFAVSIGLLCVSFSYSETDYTQENIPSDVEEVKNSVVGLYIKNKIGIVKFGTGFILEDGLLATNAHIARNILFKKNFISKTDSVPLSQIKIFQENRLLDVQITSVQALDLVHDLALLNIKGDIPPSIKKSRRKLDLTKEQLFLVGYPRGKLKTMSQKGPIEIFELEDRIEEVHMPVSNNDLAGASGSPIVNQKGEVVGVVYTGIAFENKIVFSNSDLLFSLQNAEYGVQCSKNKSIKKCFKKAEDFHLKEALKGDVYTQYILGSKFKYIKGRKGLKLLKKAAQQGFVLAQAELGFTLHSLESYKETLKWLDLAAQQGHGNSAFALGSMYYDGEGVSQDYEQAFQYFEQAAQKGHTVAQYRLGNAYLRGEGVPQDSKKAIEYFELAAQAGNKEAYYILGFMDCYINEKKHFDHLAKRFQEGNKEDQNFFKELVKDNKCIEAVINKGVQ